MTATEGPREAGIERPLLLGTSKVHDLTMRASRHILHSLFGAGVALHLIAHAGCMTTRASRPPEASVEAPLPESPRAASVSGDVARVIASAREVRVIFPRDTALRWGWGDPPYHSTGSYRWQMHVDGVARPHTLLWTLDAHPDRVRTFTSLGALVAAGRASACESTGSFIATCTATGVTSAVVDRRVVLILRDSTTIARMFGLRPGKVGTFVLAPGVSTDWRRDSSGWPSRTPRGWRWSSRGVTETSVADPRPCRIPAGCLPTRTSR